MVTIKGAHIKKSSSSVDVSLRNINMNAFLQKKKNFLRGFIRWKIDFCISSSSRLMNCNVVMHGNISAVCGKFYRTGLVE